MATAATNLIRTLLLSALLLSSAAASGQACSGTKEERLQCHAGEVKDLLQRWVRSWGEGDIETYLSLYSVSRSPSDDMSRETWVQNRRERIGPDKRIEIDLKLESLGLEDSGLFDIVFDQHYRSANYEDVVKKRLFLIREAGELRIWKEEVVR